MEAKGKEQIEEAGVLHRRIIVQLVDYLANIFMCEVQSKNLSKEKVSIHTSNLNLLTRWKEQVRQNRNVFLLYWPFTVRDLSIEQLLLMLSR